MVKVKIIENDNKIINKIKDEKFIHNLEDVLDMFFENGYIKWFGEIITKKCELIQNIYDLIDNETEIKDKDVKIYMNKKTKQAIIDILKNPYQYRPLDITITKDEFTQAIKHGVVIKIK